MCNQEIFTDKFWGFYFYSGVIEDSVLRYDAASLGITEGSVNVRNTWTFCGVTHALMRMYPIHTYAVTQYNICWNLVEISLWQRILKLLFLLFCFSHLWYQTISACQNLFMLSIVLIIFRHHLSLRYLVILRPHLNLHSQRNGRQIKFQDCLVPIDSLYFVFASTNSNTRKIKTYKTQFWILFCMGMKLGLFHKGKNVQLGISEDRILKRTCEPKRK